MHKYFLPTCFEKSMPKNRQRPYQKDLLRDVIKSGYASSAFTTKSLDVALVIVMRTSDLKTVARVLPVCYSALCGVDK
jgi:hypothetical protein